MYYVCMFYTSVCVYAYGYVCMFFVCMYVYALYNCICMYYIYGMCVCCIYVHVYIYVCVVCMYACTYCIVYIVSVCMACVYVCTYCMACEYVGYVLCACVYVLYMCIYMYCVSLQVRGLPCAHNFHVGCIDEWLRLNIKCPRCRCSVFPNLDLSALGGGNTRRLHGVSSMYFGGDVPS